MKKQFLLSFLLVFLGLSSAVFAQDEAVAQISFDEETFDFGEIKQGDVVEHEFVFKNTGNAPLQLTNVATTCGCTAPDWPREVIAPGETSKITVKFNSRGKRGTQKKVISIYSNASESIKRINITSNVLMPEEGK